MQNCRIVYCGYPRHPGTTDKMMLFMIKLCYSTYKIIICDQSIRCSCLQAVFLIRFHGTSNGVRNCFVVQCYDKTWVTLVSSKMGWYC